MYNVALSILIFGAVDSIEPDNTIAVVTVCPVVSVFTGWKIYVELLSASISSSASQAVLAPESWCWTEVSLTGLNVAEY